MMTDDEWDRAERTIVGAWTTGDVPLAMTEIENALIQGTGEIRGRALVYRGTIHEEGGNLDQAKADFIEAAGLFVSGSYAKYSAELSVAHVCEEREITDQAIRWYRRALQTCVDSTEPFSAAVAARAFLRHSSPVSTPDLELLQSVTTKSWRALGLPNEPNLTDLAGTADLMIKRGSESEL